MDRPHCHFGPEIFLHFVSFPFFFTTSNREVDEHGYGALINPYVLLAWIRESIMLHSSKFNYYSNSNC